MRSAQLDTEVEFKSNAFRPLLPEESQVNPGRYGAELAWWLCGRLATKGVFTAYPNFEDWGWFVEYIVDDNEYWLCCGNIDGTDDRWLVYLKAHAKSMFGRNRAPLETAAPLLNALREVLEESEEVAEIEWRAS